MLHTFFLYIRAGSVALGLSGPIFCLHGILYHVNKTFHLCHKLSFAYEHGCIPMNLPHLIEGNPVESLNKGHFGTALFVFVRRVSSLGGAKCIKKHREGVFWDLMLCPL